MRLRVISSDSTYYWSVTNAAPAKPYLQISNQYLPLTTATISGVKFKVQSGNTSYRACVYQSGYYNTTSSAVGNLSSTTALTRKSTSGYETAVSTVSNNSTTMKTFTYEGRFSTQSNSSSLNDRYGIVRILNDQAYRAVARYETTATSPTYGTQIRGNYWVGDYGPDYRTVTDPAQNIYHITEVTALTVSHNVMGASRAVVSMPYGPRLHAAGYMVSGQMGYTSYVTLTNGNTLTSSTWIGNTADTETRWLTNIIGRSTTWTFNVTTWSTNSTKDCATIITEWTYYPPGQQWGEYVNKTSYIYLRSTYTYVSTNKVTVTATRNTNMNYLNGTYTDLTYIATKSGFWGNTTRESTVTWITDTYSNTKTSKATISGGWHVTVTFEDVGVSTSTVITSTQKVTTSTLTCSSTSGYSGKLSSSKWA